RVELGQSHASQLQGSRWSYARFVHEGAGPKGPGKKVSGAALSRGPRAVPRPARFGALGDFGDGVFGLLPDRPGLHQLGKRTAHPSRPGAWLRGRVLGGLRASNYGSGSAAVPLALRAVFEPGKGIDAGLRHRLLPI